MSPPRRRSRAGSAGSALAAWLVCVALGMGFATLSFARAPAPATALPDLHFDEAEFVVSDAGEPPPDGWRAQALPDEWKLDHPQLSGIAWYRMRFTLEAPPAQALALFVPRVAVTGEFRLNGSVLNPEVRFTPPGGLIGSQMTNQAQLLTLPTGLFRVGENVLHIRVQGNTVTGGTLSAVRIGPAASLRGPWLWHHIPQRVIPQALFVLMTATLVFGLVIWWRARRAIHRHFALAMALWTTLLGCYLFPELPLTRNGLAITLILLAISSLWALLGLCWRFSRSTWRWFPWVLNISSALTLAAAVVMALTGQLLDLLGWLLLPSLLLRVLTTSMLAQWAWRERSLRAFALVGAELVWFAGTLQFLAIRLRWLPAEPFMLSPSDELPLYLVLLYFFVERFILDHGQAARDQQAAIDAERSRILHDMHDGMGSQLVTALRLAQRKDADPGVVARSIDGALQDLRLIIDSLDLAEQDLLPLLGNLRYRLQPQLAALGIRLDWRVQAAPELVGLTPQSALGVLRIVQEALNNAVRHARPSVIAVTIAGRDSGAVIDVADDGIGFDVGAPRSGGRGLAGMRERAARLGAQMSVTARDGGGTVVSLRLQQASAAMPSPGFA